jgi:hypothetical protein
MKYIKILLALLVTLGCSRSYNVYFSIDERYLHAIPQYQAGRSFINANFDTLTFTLTSTESSWPIVGYDPSEERYYCVEQKKFNYIEKNNPDLSFYFELRTYPDLERNKVAGTELVCVSLSKSPFRFAFLPTDTLVEAPSVFVGNYVVQGKLYERVYSDLSSYYYTTDGEILRFKLTNGEWYDAIPE